MLPKEYFTFFKQLEKNNNKEWFDAHRKNYENFVKKPFLQFVTEVMDAIRTIDPDLQMLPKEAIFRINRDVRFSKDKSPYKTHMSAHVTKYGKKELGRPGFYFEVNASGGAIAGGCYQPDKETLSFIRDLIMHEGKDLHKVIKAKSFRDKFGELQGDKNKILPVEFKLAAEKEPLLFNKQFFYWTELSKDLVDGKDAVKNVLAYYKAGKPVQDYFSRAFS